MIKTITIFFSFIIILLSLPLHTSYGNTKEGLLHTYEQEIRKLSSGEKMIKKIDKILEKDAEVLEKIKQKLEKINKKLKNKTDTKSKKIQTIINYIIVKIELSRSTEKKSGLLKRITKKNYISISGERLEKIKKSKAQSRYTK